MRSKATYSIRTNGDYFPETFTDIQNAWLVFALVGFLSCSSHAVQFRPLWKC